MCASVPFCRWRIGSDSIPAGACVHPNHGAVPRVQTEASSRRERQAWNRTGRKPLNSRSEEHTSELQSPCKLVCRLLLEKKKKNQKTKTKKNKKKKKKKKEKKEDKT